MPLTITLGTRKGLFQFRKASNGQWQSHAPEFMAEPVTATLHDTRSETRYCALNLGHFGVKLHRAKPGQPWQEINAPAFPKSDAPDAPSVEQIWTLAASGKDQPGTLWAGTIPGALFKSDDHGDTWHLVESLWQQPEREQWFGGGYDQPGIHSICVDPRNSQRLVIAVSCGGVWESIDNGASWTLQGHGMRAAYTPPDQSDNRAIQDPHRMAQCHTSPDTLWVQHHNGIFLSRDGGHNWHEIAPVEPSSFGFAVVAHPHDSNTAWFIPAIKDECRVPANGELLVNLTRDGGKTFTALRNGLPQSHCYDLIYRHAFAVDDSGECLAFASTTGNFFVSEDGGKHWQWVSQTLPPVYTTEISHD